MQEELVPNKNVVASPQEAPITRLDYLTLNVDDTELIKRINFRIEDAKAEFAKLKIDDRRKENLDYLIGNQLPTNLKTWQSKFVDNVIYESEGSIKPIAMSSLPDLLIEGNGTPESAESAKVLTNHINNDLRSHEKRKVLSRSLRHHPVYLIGVLKCVWKSDLNEYVFESILPSNIVLDPYATEANPDQMGFIAETYKMEVSDMLERFPDKAEQIYAKCGIKLDDNGGMQGDNTTKLGSKVDVWETWFTERFGGKVYEGMCLKWGDILLWKGLNPYYDYEGKTMTVLEDGSEVTPDIINGILSGQLPDMPMEQTKVMYNYFTYPRKPYILISYDQWGDGPLDKTSRIEQNLRPQDALNKVGRKIIEMTDKMRGKDVFSKLSGLKKKDVAEIDLDDPDSSLLVDNKLSDVYTKIPGEKPPAELFAMRDNLKDTIFSKAGTHDTTRGKFETDTAKTSEILRDADYGKIDDYVKETIDYAVWEMARWSLHMIKLFYTEDHFKRIKGEKGEQILTRLHRDMIDDGLEVVVSTTGADKNLRKQRALKMAELKLTDPITFFEDLEMDDPKGRTEKLMLFQQDPATYMQKYVLEQAPALPMGQDAIDAETVDPAGASLEQPVSGEPVDDTTLTMMGGMV